MMYTVCVRTSGRLYSVHCNTQCKLQRHQVARRRRQLSWRCRVTPKAQSWMCNHWICKNAQRRRVRCHLTESSRLAIGGINLISLPDQQEDKKEWQKEREEDKKEWEEAEKKRETERRFLFFGTAISAVAVGIATATAGFGSRAILQGDRRGLEGDFDGTPALERNLTGSSSQQQSRTHSIRSRSN